MAHAYRSLASRHVTFTHHMRYLKFSLTSEFWCCTRSCLLYSCCCGCCCRFIQIRSSMLRLPLRSFVTLWKDLVISVIYSSLTVWLSSHDTLLSLGTCTVTQSAARGKDILLPFPSFFPLSSLFSTFLIYLYMPLPFLFSTLLLCCEVAVIKSSFEAPVVWLIY